MLCKLHDIDLTVIVGVIIAAILSWKSNKDKLWCVVHALLGWIYVIYWAFVKWPRNDD